MAELPKENKMTTLEEGIPEQEEMVDISNFIRISISKVLRAELETDARIGNLIRKYLYLKKHLKGGYVGEDIITIGSKQGKRIKVRCSVELDVEAKNRVIITFSLL
jgi:hypothetical protein